MNMTMLLRATLLPGGALHIPAPRLVIGLPNYGRVVVFEWPHSGHQQISHRGVAHYFSIGQGNPSSSRYYFKTWCQFHGRYHYLVDLVEVFHGNAGGAGAGQLFQPPPVPVVLIGPHPLHDIIEVLDDDHVAGGGVVNNGAPGQPVLEGDDHVGGGGGHHCTGMINADASIFWDLHGGAHHGAAD